LMVTDWSRYQTAARGDNTQQNQLALPQKTDDRRLAVPIVVG
jgi:hypothetical protein